jgi:signal transduction histidine kinase
LSGDLVELKIADTGVGISAEELPRLFERFRRVKGARSRTHEGTGIGLALVRELVSLHGGTVQIESVEGSGSTFTVRIKTGTSHLPAERLGAGHSLPSTVMGADLYIAEALHWLPSGAGPGGVFSALEPADGFTTVEAATSLTKGQAADVRTPGTRRPRILLADDNADMRDYVSRLLARCYDVQAVPDGSTALAAAQREAPDLILTDVMMPGLDGFGLLRELRADPRTQAIPIVFLSARAGEGSSVEGLNAGADDYLAKPFSAQELLARVGTHVQLGRARRLWAAELDQSNKELEAFSYCVSHDLRAPLRAIDGFSSALIEGYAEGLDGQASHYLRRIRAGAQKMSIFINDLLELSRVGRGGMRMETINLTAMARRVVAKLQIDTTRDVTVGIAEGLSTYGDSRLISIALEHLVNNSWKYTSKQRTAVITFGEENQDGERVYYIRDNGVGFDMAYSKNLFAPFHRLCRDSEFDGTGIGLATTQRIISRHGGRIWAKAAVNQGATFYFTLGLRS